jgi:hypothetical protein
MNHEQYCMMRECIGYSPCEKCRNAFYAGQQNSPALELLRGFEEAYNKNNFVMLSMFDWHKEHSAKINEVLGKK